MKLSKRAQEILLENSEKVIKEYRESQYVNFSPAKKHIIVNTLALLLVKSVEGFNKIHFLEKHLT